MKDSSRFRHSSQPKENKTIEHDSIKAPENYDIESTESVEAAEDSPTVEKDSVAETAQETAVNNPKIAESKSDDQSKTVKEPETTEANSTATTEKLANRDASKEAKLNDDDSRLGLNNLVTKNSILPLLISVAILGAIFYSFNKTAPKTDSAHITKPNKQDQSERFEPTTLNENAAKITGATETITQPNKQDQSERFEPTTLNENAAKTTGATKTITQPNKQDQSERFEPTTLNENAGNASSVNKEDAAKDNLSSSDQSKAQAQQDSAANAPAAAFSTQRIEQADNGAQIKQSSNYAQQSESVKSDYSKLNQALEENKLNQAAKLIDQQTPNKSTAEQVAPVQTAPDNKAPDQQSINAQNLSSSAQIGQSDKVNSNGEINSVGEDKHSGPVNYGHEANSAGSANNAGAVNNAGAANNASAVNQADKVRQADNVSTANAVSAIDKPVDTMPMALLSSASKVFLSHKAILEEHLINLQTAVNSGKPFRKMLSSYLAVKDDPLTYALLNDSADKGIPTLADLQRSFPAIADLIVQAINAKALSEEEKSPLKYFWSHIIHIVAIRDTDPDTNDPASKLALELESLLKEGKLTSFLNKWQSLPEKAQLVSKEFKEQVEKRLKVNLWFDKLLERSKNTE